ncbi:hypothetical protein PO002_38645 [Cupriavidus necator]|uniref:hypothetical protein n=1 Tax=Cupriavidus necator TaxID=106590 RepID=UPI0039C0DC89
MAPQAAFALLLGFVRHAYENEYLGAMYYNQHRDQRLRELVAHSQVPLEIVASSYCAPGDGQSLGKLRASMATMLEARPARLGGALVRHSPLPAWNDLLEYDQHGNETGPPRDRFDVLLDTLLGPILEAVHGLQQAGRRYAPAVRLVEGSPKFAKRRLEQLRKRLHAFGLSVLDCDLADSSDASQGLMLGDNWLDQEITTPLLLVATQLHEVPPEGSAEAAVALLMVPKRLALPSGMHPLGRLHRPIACALEQFDAGCRAALRAGLADANTVGTLWMAGIPEEADAAVSSGFADANLSALSDSKRLCHLDRALGHAGVAAGWLAVAGALETGADGAPQFVMSQLDPMQLAVVYTYPKKDNNDVAEP